MRNFVCGLIIGIAISTVTAAYGAQIVGDSGWLFGWDVTVNGNTVCSDPFIWAGIREIEC